MCIRDRNKTMLKIKKNALPCPVNLLMILLEVERKERKKTSIEQLQKYKSINMKILFF